MIAVDWGSSSLRAFRVESDGRVRETRRTDQGLLHVGGRFADVLGQLIDGWDDALVVLAGMVGSRQGWQEVPYVQAPVGLQDIAAGMRLLDGDAMPGRALWLVPGVSCFDAHQVPDVMRGEETQLCGLLPTLGAGSHHVLLPGTHSKHVRIVDGRIEGFSTFMTGEVFAVLRQHSLLGRMMVDAPHDDAAFADGMSMASRGDALLHHLFSVRTRALFDQLAPEQLTSYLSGLLIGHEVQSLSASGGTVQVIASDDLAARYLTALKLRGMQAALHGEESAARGMHLLAHARGLPV
ncbi:2-dehydro-3-deoxygalactonokinase [Stenotrophomonas sp. 169]|uniref:2-dehydro-3-deoxygalactonokinase n=1 Tax=Stenotrophomonas sp. 169 TaxID=2770322 RepID=UPI001662246F|nr:2-dehydro-3-deoxygalactonokinase [Stenotrophomonas sp. 169]QNR98291.1 2-dehydro-3-deoxygalactonokinase [Stenotrophomonas sp. 169]